MAKMQKACLSNQSLSPTLVNIASLYLLQTPRSLTKPLQLMVLRHRALILLFYQSWSPMEKQHEGKQGGDACRGKDWRSELIPHVPQEVNFKAGTRLVGGWWSTASTESTSLHFAALFTHTLLWTESTWIHLAQLRHKAQFTFLANARAPESRSFTETNRT